MIIDIIYDVKIILGKFYYGIILLFYKYIFWFFIRKCILLIWYDKKVVYRV